MPSFHYIAKNAAGQEITGVLQADNELAAVRALDEKKLFPVQVEAQESAGRRRGRRINAGELGILYGQLSDLLKSGVPLMRSLETLARAGTNAKMVAAITAVKDDVAAGKTLADSMASRPEVFEPLHCAMIRAGERAGFLEDVLVNLATFLERQDELRGKVRGAMVYPIVLCGIGAVMLLGILTILVPKFKGFFKDMPLPAPTVVLFGFSDLLVNNLLAVLAVTVVVVLGVRALLKSDAGRMTWDAWRLKIPVLGKTILMVSITRFCRILGTMLANGVPILQSLAISKDATGCLALSACVEKAAESVKGGQPLAEPLKSSGLFPPEIIEMIAVAEESNQLEKVLVQIADTVERRTNRKVDQAVRLIEPLILVVMATLIGFVAVGLLYPIFTMSQAMSH